MKNNFDFNDLICEISNDIENTMKTKITDKIIEISEKSVQENVLDVYEPKVYKRRSGHNSGGLKDTWKSEVTNNNDKISLKIKNDAKPINSKDGVDLDEIIEYGTSTEKDAPIYKRPRPFIEPVQEELENTDIIEKILKENISYIK